MSKLKKALERAKEDRELYGKSPESPESDDSAMPSFIPDFPDSFINESLSTDRELNPVYVHTKVQQVDLIALEKKKIIVDCRKSDVADKIKILRTQLLKELKSKGKNSILVTSAKPGEGKTTTAVNLAISLSQQLDSTVLLVDADLRRPSIENLFGITADKGLSHYLLGKAELPELLINPGIPSLVILPGGKPLVNSAELLGAPRMQSLVKELKTRYEDRFIVFDSPSLLTCADPLVLSNFTDCILMVLEAEHTSQDDFKRALDLLEDKFVIGTVLNKVRR